MNFRIFILVLSVTLLVTSCKTKKIVHNTPSKKTSTVKRAPQKTTESKPKSTIVKVKPVVKKLSSTRSSYTNKVENYIAKYSEVAMQQMESYKIPASITLAQGILESGAGQGELTKKANNHFGIKCHNWKGARVYHDDDASQECFRKYSNANFSFQDHSLFLTERKRYTGLFQLAIDDYKKWAKGLRAAGYATDPKYPSKLISIIEKYKLYNYDAKVLGKSLKDAKKVTTKSDQYTVSKGDTLYSIARKNKIKVEELKAINGLESNTIHEGQTLYVTPLSKEY